MDPNFTQVLKGELETRINNESQAFRISFEVEDHPEFRKITVISIIHTYTYLRYAQDSSYEAINQMGSNAVDIVSSTFIDKLSVSLHQMLDKIFGTSLD